MLITREANGGLLSPDVVMGNFKHITIERHFILIHVKPNYDYEIAISRCGTCAEICNWLGQIAEKSWCNYELLGELVIAFNIVNVDLRGVK